MGLVPLPALESHLVVSASTGNALRTWDTRTGALVKEHRGHRGPAWCCCWTRSNFVLTAVDDGACLVFTVEWNRYYVRLSLIIDRTRRWPRRHGSAQDSF